MKEKNGEHRLSHTGQVILCMLFLAVWVGDSFFLRISTVLSTAVPLAMPLVLAGLIMVPAVCLVRSGHSAVPHEQRPADVITTGAFRYVRHPLYLGSILTYVGLAISTLSILSLALCAVIFLFYDFLASYEEKLLEARFGGTYHAYRKRTGKWFPRIHSILKRQP
jgi:protein-S-isoprenylcysteine O-methyltransferase Ste14